ncbi:sensor histidine kinase [Parafrankia elaeagni]|uniref:sensor histidine kinase n=1 Tax=Parafrankia elaeagni TaxID=222534 RepID=UPI0003645D47|nr:histidine kinase [Parafrankia elaeagni]
MNLGRSGGTPLGRPARDSAADPLAGMVRLADGAVYGLTCLAALISALLVGAEPVALVLILLAVAAPAAEIGGRRVPPALAAPVSVASVTGLILLDAPKSALLVLVAVAAWVALRSPSVPLNASMVTAVVVLSYVDFSRQPAGEHDGYLASGSIVWGAAALYATATGGVLRRTGVLAAELARAQDQLVAAAATDERRRIAQDVHDLVAHSLAVALLNITGARRLIRSEPARADEALARAEDVGRESLQGIRRVVGLLGGDSRGGGGGGSGVGVGGGGGGMGAGPLPAAHDIGALVEGYRRSGMEVAFSVVDDRGQDSLDGLDQAAGSVLFRTVREALANVLHHAGGAATAISIEVVAAAVHVVIRNDAPRWGLRGPASGNGAGAPERRFAARGGQLAGGESGSGGSGSAGRAAAGLAGPRPPGMGLSGMIERVHALGGSITAGPRDDGWEVAASIPMMTAGGPVGPVGSAAGGAR